MRWTWRVCLVAGPLALVSCTSPQVEMAGRPVGGSRMELQLTDPVELADRTVATLRREDLRQHYRRDPVGALRELARRYRLAPDESRRLAVAELASDRGDGLARERPFEAVGFYLDAASLCQAGALNMAGGDQGTPEEVLYRHSVAGLVRVLHQSGWEGKLPLSVQGVLGSYRLGLARGSGLVSPQEFDHFYPARHMKLTGRRIARVEQKGFGAAMVGSMRSTPDQTAEESMIPEGGFALALNASLRFSGRRTDLVLQDLLKASVARIGGRKIPLAGDFTAPLVLMYMGGPEEITRRMQGMLRPGENEESSRLYSLEPFRKDKIPLILVHGLLATEETWLPFVNLLRADPVVRENYQIVIYNYPNGYAIGKNAYRLHAALDDFRRIHDPERTNAKMRRMVIVGHSMGGILSDIQVRDSGDRVYEMLFDRPLAELELDEDKKAEVRRYLFFESNPDLTRVVFIASPHRGSKYASNPIGQVGSFLIRLPLNLVDSVFGEIRAVNALTTAGRRFARQPRNSVGSLRPDNPVLSATLGLPVREGVEMHSIIAQANWWRPKEEGSDLVVRYGSAHLDAAASEKVVVKAHHTSVLEHRETIGEVWRILRLHGGFPARAKGL